jgi:hypothetical protein
VDRREEEMDLGCEFCIIDCGSIIGSTLEACFGLCLRIPESFVKGGLGEFYHSIVKLIMG